MRDFMYEVNKDELKKQFTKDWEKHYKLKVLIERGFKRQACQKCSRNFWSQSERDFCADPSCIGYQFIGNTPVKKKLDYIDTWKTVEKYFTKNGHGYVKPYPTVARWRDDLYFTVASINDFQPYVVNGELEAPANPLIVPQPCIRFPDISNVGVSGRHYTNFVMIGQCAFNTEKTGLKYWKEEAIMHDINYLKELGIPEHELVFMEDVWAGGGNFGPSMEYFARGLELGNCVFMQYEVMPSGPRELKTKVIDMGAGLSRLTWMTNGDPTSYESVFGAVIQKMKKDNGISIDKELFLKYAKISGSLNEDEVPDLEAEKEKIAKTLSVSKKELFSTLEPLQALYATADHTLTLLFTVTDGMLPSNAGGGYNLRMILRRVFGFEQKFNFNLDFAKILKAHAEHLDYMFPHLSEGVETTIAVIEEEKKKYLTTKEKAKGRVLQIVQKAKGAKITSKDLFTLYKSNGIPPEYVVEVANEQKVEVEMPGNFYAKVREKDEVSPEQETKISVDVVNYPKTKTLYYSKEKTFEAKIIDVVGKSIILDQTCFYPEGGGQASDVGLINGEKVSHVSKQSGVILHHLENTSKFKKDQTIKGEVDLVRRLIITRHHTCAHLLNAASREVLGRHIWQGGSNKDEHKAHLDITHYKKITQEELDKIESKVNEYIMSDLKIVVEVLPRNVAESKYGFTLYQGGAVPGKELRIVSIGGIDNEACGGTHHMLNSTGEIGYFKIVRRESIQDGIERITYKSGAVAVKYVQEKEKLLRDACSIFSISDSDLVKTTERFFNEWKDQKKSIEKLVEDIAKNESQELISLSISSKSTVLRMLDMDKLQISKIGSLISQNDLASAVILNKSGDLVCAAGQNSSKSAKELMSRIVLKLSGNGGGNERFATGKIQKVPITISEEALGL